MSGGSAFGNYSFHSSQEEAKNANEQQSMGS